MEEVVITIQDCIDGHMKMVCIFTEKIVSEGKAFLKENGWMLFEIGYD